MKVVQFEEIARKAAKESREGPGLLEELSKIEEQMREWGALHAEKTVRVEHCHIWSSGC